MRMLASAKLVLPLKFMRMADLVRLMTDPQT